MILLHDTTHYRNSMTSLILWHPQNIPLESSSKQASDDIVLNDMQLIIGGPKY